MWPVWLCTIWAVVVIAMCKKGVTRDVMVDLTYLKREEATPRGAQGGEGRWPKIL
jgi:hypothetical protein